MKYVKNSRKSFKSRKPFKKNVKRSYPKSNKRFVNSVKKIIAKDVETKTNVFTSNVTAFNQQINSSGDCLRLMPAIANGTAENQKIGNNIKLQSLNIRGVLTFTLGQTVADNVRIGVRLMVLRPKKYNDWNAGSLDFNTNYTKLLEGTTTGFQGTLQQFNTPTNNDYFSVVMDRRFYMSQSVQQSGVATPGQSYISETTKFVNFKVPYTTNKKLIYDQDSSLDESTNFPYFMILGYTKLSGASADATGTSYLTFQYTATAKYEDA